MRRCACVAMSLIIAAAGFPIVSAADGGNNMQSILPLLRECAKDCRNEDECAARQTALAAVEQATASGRRLTIQEQKLAARAFPSVYFSSPEAEGHSLSCNQKPGQQPFVAADAVATMALVGAVSGVIGLISNVWFVTNSSRPDTNAENTNFVNAVPAGVSWDQLTGGRKASYLHTFTHEGWFAAVKIQYVVEYTYGRKHKDRGFYLTNVTARPVNKYIPWAFKTFVSIGAGSPEEEPGPEGQHVGVIPLVVNINVESPVRAYGYITRYKVSGTGQLTSCEQQNGTKSCKDITSLVKEEN